MLFLSIVIKKMIILTNTLRKIINKLWSQRIHGPGPFYVKAQGPSRGEPLPRMTSCSALHEMPKERGKLGVGAEQGKKLPTS